MASLAGSLHGIMTSTPRVSHALASRRDLPRLVRPCPSALRDAGQLDPVLRRFAGALAISGSFVWLAVVSTLARMIVYAVTIAALPRAPASAGWRHGIGSWARSVSWSAPGRCPRPTGRPGRRSALSAVGLLLYAIARGRCLVKRRRRRLGDPAAAEQPRAVVEDRRLARRDAIFGRSNGPVAIDFAPDRAAPGSAP